MDYYGNNDWRDYLRRQNDLAHFGIPRKSGRYPWGSGDNPYHHGADGPGAKLRKKVVRKLRSSKSPVARGVGQYINEHTNRDAMDDQENMDVTLRGLIKAERRKDELEAERKKSEREAELQKRIEAVPKLKESSEYGRDEYDKYLDDYISRFNLSDDSKKSFKVDISKDDVGFDEETLKAVNKAINKPISATSALSDNDVKVLKDMLAEFSDWEADGLSKRDFDLKHQILEKLKNNENSKNKDA